MGNDVLGIAVTDRLKQEGLDTSAVFATDQAQTSATIVAVEAGGERCFFHTPGATTRLDGPAFRRCFPIFRQCKWVQIGYFGLLPGLTGILPEVLKELRAAAPNVKIAMDTVAPPGRWEELEPILPHLDLFCPSRSEAAALSGENQPEKIVLRFRQFMKQGTIGIKLDSEGCYLDDGRQAIKVPSYKVKVVDTTGAGDTWFAGLLTALIKGMPLDQAGRLANRVAADCCTALGASAGIRGFADTIGRI